MSLNYMHLYLDIISCICRHSSIFEIHQGVEKGAKPIIALGEL